jgi:hypothetical protein
MTLKESQINYNFISPNKIKKQKYFIFDIAMVYVNMI